MFANMFVLSSDSQGNVVAAGTRNLGGGVTVRPVKLIWIAPDIRMCFGMGNFAFAANVIGLAVGFSQASARSHGVLRFPVSPLRNR